MPDRRDLTERNRENQRPLPPSDFCQGLPFKVRWMGRDAETGRDLVQFPDGSIVRAGKRIFSGNCPRGTMVDVVDCGVNGFITIDWRDAEVREPLLIPENIRDWVMIIDSTPLRATIFDREEYKAAALQYIQNIKDGQRALLVQYSFFGSTALDQSADSFVQSLAGMTAEDLAGYQQLWVGSTINDIPQEEIDLIAGFVGKLALFATSFAQEHIPSFGFVGVAERIMNKKFNMRVFDGYYEGFNGTDIPPEKVTTTGDPLFKGIPKLPGGRCSKITPPPGFEVIATAKAYRQDTGSTTEEDVPTIAILRK